MSNESGTPAGPQRVRAGDEDRDEVVGLLREHHEAGRLTPEEFAERMEAALAARFLDELPPLLADLPGRRPHPPYGSFGGHPPYGGQRGRRTWAHHGPLLPLLLIFSIVASIGAVSHGHAPWPLLWAAVLLVWLRPWARRRAWR